MRFQTLDPWFRPEHALIIREEGRIVSQVTIFERPVRFGPAVLKMGGIGDVMTVPEYRGKGYSTLLMQAALDYMRKEKFDLTMLFGIPNYYHKFGYIEAMKNYQLEFLNSQFNLESPEYQIRKFTPQDLPEMLQLYQDNIKAANLVIDRTVPYLESKAIDPAHLLIITDAGNRLMGYAHTWDHISGVFTVIEAVTQNYEVSGVLLQEILNRKPASEPTLKIKMSPQMPFVKHIRYLGTELKSRCFGEGEGKGMLAIVDLCQLLNKLKPILEERVANSRFYQFTGKLVIQTQQSVELSFNNGILELCKSYQQVSADKVHFKTDFRYFVRNIVGYWSILDLLEQTDARVADPQTLDLLRVLFPEADAFLLPLDYF